MIALLCLSPANPVGATTGPNNSITDVPGVIVGHSTRIDARTGTTAIIFPNGAKMGFEPSGGSPMNRLSSLLTASHQDSQRVVFHGVTLSGGSIYGLDTVCGVNRWLREQGKGWGNPPRPFVPGAVIFDLGRGPVNAPPGRSTPASPDPCYDGYYAASHAVGGPTQEGSVGGGTGANAGGLKSGFGTASVALPNGIWVGAAIVVNAGGSTVNNTTLGQCQLYGLYLEDSGEFNGVRVPPAGCTLPQSASGLTDNDDVLVPGNNTTIGVVVTNANLTAGQLERMAIVAGDGMARAIRPAHGNGDGDAVFAASTAASPGTVQQGAYVTNTSTIYNAAADAYARAADHAVLIANPALGTTYCSRYRTACPNGPPVSKVTVPPNSPLGTTGTPTVPGPGTGATSVPVTVDAPVDDGARIGLLVGLAGLLALFGAGLLTGRGRKAAVRARRWIAMPAAMLILFGATAAWAHAAPGPKNSITDVPGVEVGHSTRLNAQTGTTSLIFRHGAIMGYDSPGGAPIGHLETLLDGQHADSQRVVFHGLVLSGGDVYGLDTICGTVRYLDEQGLGYSSPRRPHVSGGAIFDLGRGGTDMPPGLTADPCMDGYISASAASNAAVAQGSVGAGTGAVAGGVRGGIGTASTVLADGTIIGAIVVVDSTGRVYNAAGDCGLYGLNLQQGHEFGVTRVPPDGCGKVNTDIPPPTGPAQGSTIGAIATNAPLTAGQTAQLAHAGTEGQSYAIHPGHGTDGDEVFAITLPADQASPSDPANVVQTTWVEPDRFREIYNAAADTYARAIVHAALAADPTLGPTYCSMFPKAQCLLTRANCNKSLVQQKQDFKDQQKAEKKAFGDQQKAQKDAFDAQSHTPAERRAFADLQRAAKKAFDDQQTADAKAFADEQALAETECNTLPATAVTGAPIGSSYDPPANGEGFVRAASLSALLLTLIAAFAVFTRPGRSLAHRARIAALASLR